MLTTTPTLRAAITSSVRTPVTQVLLWINGDAGAAQDFSYMVKSVSIDRSPQDSPEQVSLFAGSIAAQANITLDWKHSATPEGDGRYLSRDFAPYVGTIASFLAADFGIGMKVQVFQGFITSAGAELLSEFVGRIDDVQVSGDGQVTLQCLDFLVDLKAATDLPVAAVSLGTLPVYTCVELLLRAGMFYRTPPPLADCVLSVPSVLPEIGDLGAPLAVTDITKTPKFNRSCISVQGGQYIATRDYTPILGTIVVLEGWFRQPATAGFSALSMGSGLLRITVQAGNVILNDGTVSYFSTNAWPADGGWHYLLVEFTHSTNGDITIYSQIDGVGKSTTFPGPYPLPSSVGSRAATIGDSTCDFEGVSLRSTTGATYTRQARNTWAPNYSATLLGSPPLITAIPRGQSGSAVDQIRAIATGTGAEFRFAEDGSWRYEERASVVARRFAATAADYDDTRALITSGYGYNAASRRRSVSIDWTQYALQRSTAVAPAWATADLITVAAQTVDVLNFTTDNPILGILPVKLTSVLSASYSAVQVVPASQVGDPAATSTLGISFRAVPTPTGFQVAISNPFAYAISLWDPVSGGPLFQLQGFTVVGGDSPRSYTAQSSARALEVLSLDTSPWRQSAATAMTMCDAIAVETALPAVVFDSQSIVSDPSLTVDDIIRIRDPDTMTSLIPCQIIGKTNDDDSQQDTLIVRACYPPIGWVLGLTGRSELGSTAILVA